ncbi:MAG TPA: hypothetical protein VMG36_03350, partial [Thermoplasmata archaeon]|nr:hypothetical protein [Thermoplasmata archaeon]
MEDPPLEPSMTRAARVAAVVVALAAVALLVVGAGGLPVAGAAPTPATSTPVTGNISGPRYVSLNATATYWINGSGGPAYIDGDQVGNITWKATLTGANLTGVSISPNASQIATAGVPSETNLTVGNVSETITLTVEINSTYMGTSATTNLTKQISIVVPYVVRAELVAGAERVLPFTVAVLLDGSVVGNVSIPSIAAMATYNLTFRYPSAGLSSGSHTFS